MNYLTNKKAFGSYLAALAVVILAAVVYSAFQMPSPASSNEIKKFASYEELESYLKSSASEGYAMYSAGAMMKSERMAVTGAAAPQSDSSIQESGGSTDFSQTNIQVQGVDEADIVKNDGKYIYTVSGNNVIIVDSYPAANAKIISKIPFNGSISGIFLNDNKLVVFGQKSYEYSKPEPAPMASEAKPESKMIARPDIMPRYYSWRTAVQIYDISDKNNPSLLSDISVDGDYYNSRMIGNYVYVIANQPTYYYAQQGNATVPKIYREDKAISESFPGVYYFEDVPGNIFTTIAAINLDNNDISSKVLLTNYAQNMYVSEKNIYITYTKWRSEIDYIDRMVDIVNPLVPLNIREKIDEIMALGISKQTKWQAIGEILENYTSTLSEEEQQSLQERAAEKMSGLQAEIAKEREKTVVQKISIDNGNIEYKANAEVPGNILNQFSMDEHNGYFRIATTTSGNGGIVAMTSTVSAAVEQVAVRSTGMAVAQAEKPADGITFEEQEKVSEATPTRPVPPPVQQSGPLNHVYVLDENLKIVGKLEDLAQGERIYSVRFLGDKAYMVTFRQTDPLFVLDLSNPQEPGVLGQLKIPGVSDYLHPYDETHIIGLGRDATEEGRIRGMKLALFDVSDFSNPKEMSKYIIGEQGTYSDALYDHKAFLFSKEKNLLVIPVSEYHQIKADGREYWQGKYEQGAYVFNIDLNGIALKGKITHVNETSAEEKIYYYDYLSQIRRSLYIDNVLYTLSQKMIKMNSLDSLGEINKVELPAEEQVRYEVY